MNIVAYSVIFTIVFAIQRTFRKIGILLDRVHPVVWMNSAVFE